MKRALVPEVQVYFRFRQDGPWPPVPSEGLRAAPQADGTYELLEAPFFVRNTARGDVVRAEDDGGVLWAGERVRWGGRQCVRLTTHDSTDGTTPTHALAELVALGVRGDDLPEYELLALDLGEESDLVAVKAHLDAGRDAGRWLYEEACISDRWPA